MLAEIQNYPLFQNFNSICHKMDEGDKCQVGDSICPIMKVPEETMRKIFSYLPFETLYFSLRNVCTKIQSYVDCYIKVGRASFLVGRHKCRGNPEIEINQLPKEVFIILQKPLLSFPCETSILQNSSILDKYDDRRVSILQNDISLDLHGDRRIDKVVYETKSETVVCYIYKTLKGWIHRFDLENDTWENILEKFTSLKFCEPAYVRNECSESTYKYNPMLVSEDLTLHFGDHIFCLKNFPFLLLKANDGTWLFCTIMSYKRLKV